MIISGVKKFLMGRQENEMEESRNEEIPNGQENKMHMEGSRNS